MSKLTDEQLARRFWAKVDKNGPTSSHASHLGPCWVWTASRDRKGYGQIMIDRKPRRAHRVSWSLHAGELGDSCVLHRCDNRVCVNPGHLFLGTVTDNNRDMFAKGRGVVRPFTKEVHARAMALLPRGDEHYARTEPHRLARGMKHGNAKLDDDKVVAIRREREAGASLNEIATRYGITEGAVCGVVKRRTWRHVP